MEALNSLYHIGNKYHYYGDNFINNDNKYYIKEAEEVSNMILKPSPSINYQNYKKYI